MELCIPNWQSVLMSKCSSRRNMGPGHGAAWQEGGGRRALVVAWLPVWARAALDYVANSDDPSCCVSGSDVLRPLDTLGWEDSVPPFPLMFLASDWDTSLSTSLSACNAIVYLIMVSNKVNHCFRLHTSKWKEINHVLSCTQSHTRKEMALHRSQKVQWFFSNLFLSTQHVSYQIILFIYMYIPKFLNYNFYVLMLLWGLINFLFLKA